MLLLPQSSAYTYSATFAYLVGRPGLERHGPPRATKSFGDSYSTVELQAQNWKADQDSNPEYDIQSVVCSPITLPTCGATSWTQTNNLHRRRMALYSIEL